MLLDVVDEREKFATFVLAFNLVEVTLGYMGDIFGFKEAQNLAIWVGAPEGKLLHKLPRKPTYLLKAPSLFDCSEFVLLLSTIWTLTLRFVFLAKDFCVAREAQDFLT
jgi:hypothetical protein